MASATHVYRNGTILTMDSGGSQAQALAVRGETILAVGSDAEINVVWVNITYLRKRLAALGSTVSIRSIRGVGYTLEEGPC